MKSLTFWSVTQVLLALLWTQAGVQNPGFVTGVVRSAAGAPAAGVRVYGFAYKDVAEAANGVPALESQTTTDAAGRYRLELAPGRYNIAAGSVSSPTFYPGTMDPSSSRVITVASGEVTANIDFASFVAAPARNSGVIAAPAGTGVVSGVIRFPDGTPASNIMAVAHPTSGPTSVSAAINAGTFNAGYLLAAIAGIKNRGLTDNAGRYQINNLAPGTYYIVAGYAESPNFYPGTQDVTAAKAITTTQTTKIDTADITIPIQPPGTVLSGHVLSPTGMAITDAGVILRPQGNVLPSTTYDLPSRNTRRDTAIGPDGSFEFKDIAPGTYWVEAAFSGVINVRKTVVVRDAPETDVDFRISVTRLSGRILMEDGSTPLGVENFKEVIVTSTDNPSMITSTLLTISKQGTFNRMHEAGTFQFSLRSIPDEYEIRSMRFGNVDLLTNRLEISGESPVEVEVRLAPKDRSNPDAIRVAGTVVDAVERFAPAIERVTLCCVPSTQGLRLSSALKPDRTFEFSDVKPGNYAVGFEPKLGQAAQFPLSGSIDVPSEGLRSLTLISTPGFAELQAIVSGVPPEVQPILTWTSTDGRVKVRSEKNAGGLYSAHVPVGTTYTLSVEDLSEGYVVTSRISPVFVPHTNVQGQVRPIASIAPVSVVISRSTPR